MPQATWFTTEDDTDAKGRPIKRKVERMVGTREISLLTHEADAKRLDLPQLDGGDPRPFEVIGIPLVEPGYHVVEIESLRLGQALLDKRAPMYVRTGVLLTNLGVHFKQGRENSVVWVTSLDRGKPVEGADVVVNDCFGKPLWRGRTDAKGLAVVALALDARFEHCPADDGYFVTAHKDKDLAFVFSSWQKGIESWRFDLPTSRGAEPDVLATTVFDRTLFRAGETVSMKHFIRAQTLAGLAALPADRLPTQVRIVHEGSGQKFVLPLQWNAGGRSADIDAGTSRPRPSSVSTRSRSNAKRRAAAPARWQPRAAAQLAGGRLSRRGVSPAPGRRAPERPEGRSGGGAKRCHRRADELFLRRPDDERAAARLGDVAQPLAELHGLRRILFRAAARPEQGRAGRQRRGRRQRVGKCQRRRQARRRQAASRHRSQRRCNPHSQGSAEADEAGSHRCRGQLQRSERRDADRGDERRLVAECGRSRRQGGHVDEQPRPGEIQRPCARHLGQGAEGAERRGAWPPEPDHHDTKAHRRRLLRLRQPRRGERPRPLVHRRDRRARPAGLRRQARHGGPGRAHRRSKGRARQPGGRGRQHLDHEAGRALVRAGQRRPHRRAAREEALRAGRDGTLSGAHAVSRSDGAGRGRTRGRDRDAGRDAARRRSDRRAEDRFGLGTERLRQRACAARPDPRNALVFVLHLGLEGAAVVVAQLLDRQQGLPGADGDGRSLEAGVQARRRGHRRRSRGARAAGQRRRRQGAIHGAAEGARADQGHAGRQTAGRCRRGLRRRR